MIDARQYVTNPAGRKPQDPNLVIGVAVHHSVSGDNFNASSSQSDEIGHIRTIDRYHVGLDYGGFGYHMAAFPSGRLYFCGEGQRAHVAGRNHQLVGICAIGTFTNSLPDAPQLSAILEGILYWQDRLGRSLAVGGHSQWALPGEGTACPGLIASAKWDVLLSQHQPEGGSMAIKLNADGSQRIEAEGPCIVFYNAGIPVIRIGDEKGAFPGQIAKNFGGNWVYLRNEGQPENPLQGEAWWSLTPGD